MKKLIVVCVCMLLLFVSACGEKIDTVNSDKYDLAVVTTTGSDRSSRILFYNDNLELVKEDSYKYAGMGQFQSSPAYAASSFVYYPISGSFKGGDGNKVVGIDTNNGRLHEYKIDHPNIQYVGVIGNYIYTTSNVNYVSYLTQYDKQTDKIIKEVEYMGIYAHLLIPADDKILVFSSNMNEETPLSMVHVYDKNLELIEEQSIDEYGQNSYKYCFRDNYVYVPIQVDKDDRQVSRVLSINLHDYSMKSFDMMLPFINELIVWEDKFVALFNSGSTEETSTLAILNPETMEIIEKYEVDAAINHIQRNGNVLYADTALGTENQLLIKFDLEYGIREVKRVKIDMKNQVYISSIFSSRTD